MRTRSKADLKVGLYVPTVRHVLETYVEAGLQTGLPPLTSEETVPIGRFMSFEYYRSFDVTPDGERFLVVLPPEQSDVEAPQDRVNIVVNWTEELKRLVPVEN